MNIISSFPKPSGVPRITDTSKRSSLAVGRFLLAISTLFALPIAANAQKINEFVTFHADLDAGAGVDQNSKEFIEIFGDPDTNYSTFSILVIDGDRGSLGVIDNIFTVGTTDANGYWSTLSGGLMTAGDDIEQGTLTILLVKDLVQGNNGGGTPLLNQGHGLLNGLNNRRCVFYAGFAGHNADADTFLDNGNSLAEDIGCII